MANIMDFIQLASNNLGTSPSTTRSATSVLLQFIQKKADPKDFEQLTSNLSGSAELAKEAAAESQTVAAGSSTGGMLGSLANQAASAIGGSGGGAGLQLANLFTKTGLGSDKLGPMISLFFNFAKTNVDGDLTSRILGKIPEAKTLLG